jgi:alkylhydroperoxidase/carboxymuconolactone decarboxylase family protein YurZ
MTRDEMGEAITHSAFWAGWPTMTAARIAKSVFDQRT